MAWDQVGPPPGRKDWPPPPPEYEGVCRRADDVAALREVSFGAKLHGAWWADGKVQSRWSANPIPAAWIAALDDLAGKERSRRVVRLFLGIVAGVLASPDRLAKARAGTGRQATASAANDVIRVERRRKPQAGPVPADRTEECA